MSAAVRTLAIIEDTRQVAMPWPAGVVVEQRTMPEGDFTTPVLCGIAAIERLRPYRFKCVVVAKDLLCVYRTTLVHPHAIIGSIASWYARHDVPTIFVGNDAGAARLICGLLARWEQRLAAEGKAA